jgi:peroxiredoxin
VTDDAPAVDFDRLKAAAQEMIADLRRRGTVAGIAIGEVAPDFVLPDATGEKVALADRRAAGPVVVSFYRGAWCPYCSRELHDQQEILAEIRALGGSLIAISPQRSDDSLSLVERLGLGFDVLSDVDQDVIRAYHLQFELPDTLQAIYPLLGIDLTRQNADGSWHLPVPATFVIDRDGVVRARHVDPNYLERMETADLLDALRQLR